MRTLATHPMTAAAMARLADRLPFKHAYDDVLTKATSKVPAIATDGTTIYVNRAYFTDHTPDGQAYLLAFITTMKFNRMLERRGERDHVIWGYASNIAVNAQLAELGMDGIPEGALREPALDGRTADEIYDLLMARDPSIGDRLMELVETHFAPHLPVEALFGDGSAVVAPHGEAHA